MCLGKTGARHSLELQASSLPACDRISVTLNRSWNAFHKNQMLGKIEGEGEGGAGGGHYLAEKKWQAVVHQ